MGKNKGMTQGFTTELREATLSVKPPQVVTIKKAVDLICKMHDILTNKSLYNFTLNLMKDKSNREIFKTMPKEDKLWWIRSAFEDAHL